MKLGREGRATATAAMSPTLRDLEWAAGFLDGEGSFTQNSGSQMVSASQTETPEIIARLLRLFGGALWHRSKRANRQAGINSRDQLVWYVCGARARGIMLTLYALLSPRRQRQIRAALIRTAWPVSSLYCRHGHFVAGANRYEYRGIRGCRLCRHANTARHREKENHAHAAV